MDVVSRQGGPVLLVCSSGGHLTQLMALRPWWERRCRSWVTWDTEHARSILSGEVITRGHFPTTRHAGNLVRNAFLAARLLVPPRRRPSVIVSTGAGIAFPFFVLGWLLRVPTVYIEVFGRVDSRTLTGRLCRPFASLFLAQWPEQRALYPGAVLVGPLLSPGNGGPHRPPAGGAAANRPLVLVTIGTDHHSFPRLFRWVEHWLADGGEQRARVLIQHGGTAVPAGPDRVEQLGYAQLQRALREASVVVTHAATTAIEARSAGHLPVVVPRRPDLGEHVDDHQVRFARRLRADGLARVCETEDEFRDALDRSLAAAPTASAPPPATDPANRNPVAAAPTGARRAGELIEQMLSQPSSARRAASPGGGRGGPADGARQPGGWPADAPEPARWPTVTVVIPTRGDRPGLLARALEGVTSQDYPGAVDCLVVLDPPATAPGSRLGTGGPGEQAEATKVPGSGLVTAGPGKDAQAATLAVARGAGARVLRSQRTPGLPGTRNAGILAAAGELVAFCDDDDAWLPGKLRAQVAALAREPGATLACCGIAVEYEGRVFPRVHPRTTVTFDELARSRLPALHPSTFLARRTALLNGVGLVSEEIPGGRAEDWELLLRVARRGPLVNVPAPGVRVRWHAGDSSMQDTWQSRATALRWLLDRYPELGRTAASYARVAGKIAFASAACGDRADAWAWARRAIRARPLEPRPYLALAVMAGMVRPEQVVRALRRRGRGL